MIRGDLLVNGKSTSFNGVSSTEKNLFWDRELKFLMKLVTDAMAELREKEERAYVFLPRL